MQGKKKNLNERIEQLLTMAWTTSSTARILAIANQILEINPNRVEALILKADNIDDTKKSIELFQQALRVLYEPDNCNSDDRDLYFLTINQRIAFAYMGLGELDNAFTACETAIKFAEEHSDDEYINDELNNSLMKALYYRVLIERREWQRILADSMKDPENTLGRAYAKLLAAWFMSHENNKTICANLFFDALSIAPDVPFYILGFFEEPDDNAPEEEYEDFHFALMYYDTVSITDEFYNWFSKGVILFGLLSGRFDEKEQDYMIDVLDNLGGFDEYEKLKNILVETEDRAVIEALIANKSLM